MKKVLKDFVIEVIDRDHGDLVSKFFRSHGVNVFNLGFSFTLTEGDEHRFYGHVEGKFGYYSMYDLEGRGVPIYTIEVAQEVLKEKNEPLSLNADGYKELYYAACSLWRRKLRDMFANDILLKGEARVSQGRYEEIADACNPDQLKVLRTVFGIKVEYSPLIMEEGKWYEEESEKCLFQYLGNQEVMGLFRTQQKFDVWAWGNKGEYQLKELTPREVKDKLNEYKTNKSK